MHQDPRPHPFTSGQAGRSTRAATRRALAIALLLLAGGCADPERLPEYDTPMALSAATPLARHVAMLDRGHDALVLLAIDGEQVAVERYKTGRDPLALEVSPDQSQLAIVSQRDRSVTVIDVDAGREQTYALSSPFDALTFSPDGRYLLASFSPAGGAPGDELFNPNEYAVIDLDAPPDSPDAVYGRSLRNFGAAAPLGVHFVPSFDLGNAEPERYAMFLSGAYVTFADLEDPSFEVTVHLRLSASDPAVTPREVLFTMSDDAAPTLQDAYVYMLAADSDDVYTFNLLPGETAGGRVRLAPTINQLPAGDGPTDMARFVGPDGREKLLTVNAASRDVALIDAATAAVLRVPLEAGADRVHLYEALNPRTQQVEPFALVYGEASGAALVSFIALWQLEERRGQAIEALALGAPVAALFDSPVAGQAVVIHRSGGGISVIDLEGQFANPLRADFSIADHALDRGNQRLYAALDGSAKLNMIDLDTSRPATVSLDLPIERLVWLPKASSLLAFHDDAVGAVTAMRVETPAEGAQATPPPTRDQAVLYTGYLLEGLLP